MRRFLTSDTHWGHKNVIKYCDRPYSTVDEMNRDLIVKWNNKVSILDEMYFLGDFTLNPKFYRTILPRLRFKKMYFILGNHDRKSILKKVIDDLQLNIEVCSTHEVEISDIKVHMVHKPIHASDDFPTFCGHVHEKWLLKKPGEMVSERRRDIEATRTLRTPVLNVGVDVHDFVPITFEEALEHLKPYLK